MSAASVFGCYEQPTYTLGERVQLRDGRSGIVKAFIGWVVPIVYYGIEFDGATENTPMGFFRCSDVARKLA